MSLNSKHPTPYLSFDLLKFNKYLPKFILRVHLSQPSYSKVSRGRSAIRKLLKCKSIKGIIIGENVSKRENIKTNNYLLQVAKKFNTSLESFPFTLNAGSFYKNLKKLKTLRIIDNNWLAWRATRYCTGIRSLAFIDNEETEPSLKIDFTDKERYLKNFLQYQKCLQFISFKVDLKLEYYRYLSIIEGNINHMKALKGIDLDLKLQVSGLSISKQKLAKLFKYIHVFQISEPSHYLLKLADSGELEWLQDPKVLPNLRNISIKLKNDLPSSWRFLQGLQDFNLLQEFSLMLHKPDLSILRYVLRALTLPLNLKSLTLKIVGFDLSHLIEGKGWPEKRPFESDCLFSGFFNQISKVINLKTLSLHLLYTNFKSYCSDLVVGLVKSAKDLKELEVIIQEEYHRNETFENESLLASQIFESEGLETLRLEAPSIYFDKSSICSLNKIRIIEIVGNIKSHNNNQGLEMFLRLVNPEKLVLKEQVLASQTCFQNILRLINRMSRLVLLELQLHEGSLTKEEILFCIKDCLRPDIKATIRFKFDEEASKEFIELIHHIPVSLLGPYLEYSQEGLLLYKSAFYRE